ncbi:MAG: RNA-directed DNA polymerase [Deltaproteobacteria bacterium]|nr:RNA-directed DNA polymerase [Deltaproteobacteria bacterium]
MSNTQRKNILSLSSTDAKSFLLNEESYFTFDLPLYFTFQGLLDSISRQLNGKEFSNYYKQNGVGNGSLKPSNFEGVNYPLMNNKNGKFAWRLFQLIHPALYVSLVHKITSDSNWKVVTERFNKDTKVECMSLPVVSRSQQSDKAEQVAHWWEEIEQRSLAFALDYEYIFHTDITDCYGSIYTHSIAWALHTKPTAKQKRRDNDLCGNIIDTHLQSMSHGQTNGIPQGSVLMDLIAEMVLSYADEQLSEKLSVISTGEFKILRYRDDYRIFVNNPQIGETIIKYLTEVLADLGMQLNAHKTIYSNNVIRDSVKPDKFFTIVQGKEERDVQKSLFCIRYLAELYPNSGSLNKQLENLYESILKQKATRYSPEVLISLVTDLAYNNPRIYPIASAILSKTLSFLDDENLKRDLIIKIKKKFGKLPNTEHMDLWLQRITLKSFRDITYEGSLCRLAAGEKDISIWNSDWLNDSLANLIKSASLIYSAS